jgi:hypothetical protein
MLHIAVKTAKRVLVATDVELYRTCIGRILLGEVSRVRADALYLSHLHYAECRQPPHYPVPAKDYWSSIDPKDDPIAYMYELSDKWFDAFRSYWDDYQ